MTGRRALVAGLVIAMVAGLAIAWALLDEPGHTNTLVSDMEGRSSNPKAGPGPLDSANGAAAETDNQTSLDSPTGPGSQALGDPIDEDYESMGGGADPKKDSPQPPQPDDEAGEPDASDTAPGAPRTAVNRTGLVETPPVGVPSSARDPTERERAARSRYSSPDSLPHAAAMPEAGTASEKSPLDMAKLAEPEIWAEYWSREGYTPPAMVKTPVRGKLMNLLTNTQVPAAKVRVFTFFPAGSMLSGAVLPVVMEAVTDEHGFFEANLPTPERWPDNYPRFALSFEFENRRIVDCAGFENLRSGEQNEIGVFWAPEEPYELDVSAVTPEQGLTVAATGRIDPRRWETRRAKAIFPLFGPQPVSAGVSKLIGTWDIINDSPFVTLLRSGEPVLTRQCVRNADEVLRSALDGTTTMVFVEEATLDEVIARFRSDGDINIVLADSINGESITITLDIGRCKLRQALDLVADYADLSWRVENGVVIIDESGKAPAAPETAIGRPFIQVVFPNDGNLTLSGTVVDGNGIAVDGAVLTLNVDGEVQVSYSDPTGWFSFAGLPDRALELVATHEQFVPRPLEVTPGEVDTKVELVYRRPKATLRIVDAATGEPVREVWLDGMTLINVYSDADEFGEIAARHLLSPNGVYEFENDLTVILLHIQAHGYKVARVTLKQIQGEVDVAMTPSLKLERRPRDYDAAQTPELFQTDEGEGPGLWSLDDDHWVEYVIDFGEAGGKFDLILGITNHTYGTLPLDNEYLFDVNVWVDGNWVGRMHIASDPTVQQLGRTPIGTEDEDGEPVSTLTGQHTVRLMWMNDRYIPGQLDANIRYESIRFIEVP